MTDSTWELLTNPADPRHGTLSAYINHGCRCDECKLANTRQQAEARDRRAQRPVPPGVHGTENGYSNYRCRCAECIEAHNETARRKREKR